MLYQDDDDSESADSELVDEHCICSLTCFKATWRSAIDNSSIFLGSLSMGLSASGVNSSCFLSLNCLFLIRSRKFASC